MPINMSLLEYLFSDPSFLLFIAVVFFLLGASMVYFLMKPSSEYTNLLKRENEELRKAKNVLLDRLIDYNEALKEHERKRQNSS